MANRKKTISEINVVPFIDVMLVLLIVFMITAPLLNQSVDVTLPKTKSEKVVLDKDYTIVILSITKDMEYYISHDNNKGVKVENKDLGNELKKIKSQNKLIKVFIRGDDVISYGTIVKVMAKIKNEGINNVGLMTDEV